MPLSRRLEIDIIDEHGHSIHALFSRRVLMMIRQDDMLFSAWRCRCQRFLRAARAGRCLLHAARILESLPPPYARYIDIRGEIDAREPRPSPFSLAFSFTLRASFHARERSAKTILFTFCFSGDIARLFVVFRYYGRLEFCWFFFLTFHIAFSARMDRRPNKSAPLYWDQNRLIILRLLPFRRQVSAYVARRHHRLFVAPLSFSPLPSCLQRL